MKKGSCLLRFSGYCFIKPSFKQMCTLWPVGLAELGSWSCKPPAVPVMGPGLGQEVCPVGPVLGPVAGAPYLLIFASLAD